MLPFVLLLTLNSFIICTTYTEQLSSWTQPSSPKFSYSFGAKVVGYHAATNKIWLIGGFPSSALDDVHSFDVSSPTSFNQHSSLPYGSDIQAFSQLYVTAGDIIYMIRDSGNNNYISTFNMNDQTFTSSFSSVNTYTQYDAALAYIPGYLMVTGGSDSWGSALNDFQILRLSDKHWFNGPNMNQNRNELASNVNSENYLYVIGGGSASVDKINVANIEQINSGSNWNSIGTISNSDNLMRSVIFEDDIFVLGGSTGATVDIIHTLTDTIDKNVNSMQTKVRNGAPVLAANVIYYFGGFCYSCNNLVSSYQYATIPTTSPTSQPSNAPTTVVPTSYPSIQPTQNPSQQPTTIPTYIPTNTPSNVPTLIPSNVPTNTPPNVPTLIPSNVPTNTPSNVPTLIPSNVPTTMPSNVPTTAPTTTFPSIAPITNIPSNTPSNVPTTNVPSEIPSNVPTYTTDDSGNVVTDVENNGQVFDVTTTHNLDESNDARSARSNSIKIMIFAVICGILFFCVVIGIVMLFKCRQRRHKADVYFPKETADSTSPRSNQNCIELTHCSTNTNINNKQIRSRFRDNMVISNVSMNDNINVVNVVGMDIELEAEGNMEVISYSTPRPPSRRSQNEECTDDEDDMDILNDIKQTPMGVDNVNYKIPTANGDQIQIGDDEFVICAEDEVQYTSYNTMQ